MSACKPVICRRTLTAQGPAGPPGATGIGGCHSYVYASFGALPWSSSGAALDDNTPQTGAGINTLAVTTLDGDGLDATKWLEELVTHFAGGFGSVQVAISSQSTTAYAAGEVTLVTVPPLLPGIIPYYVINWINVSPNPPATDPPGPPFALKEKVTVCW